MRAAAACWRAAAAGGDGGRRLRRGRRAGMVAAAWGREGGGKGGGGEGNGGDRCGHSERRWRLWSEGGGGGGDTWGDATEERSGCFGTQRRAWKALEVESWTCSRRPLRRPHSARRGPRERPVAARGEPGVAAQWPARCLGAGRSALAPRLRPPERVRLGGGARGRERRESSRLRNGRRLRGLLRARNKSSEPRLNLSGSWQQGHSAAYNTPFLIQVVCKGFVGPGP